MKTFPNFICKDITYDYKNFIYISKLRERAYCSQDLIVWSSIKYHILTQKLKSLDINLIITNEPVQYLYLLL